MSALNDNVNKRANFGLREHIYRAHVVHQCLQCGDRFKSEESLLQHTRSIEGCLTRALTPASGVNQSKIAALRSKKAMRGQTHEERWKKVYSILFPDESHIPSPCEHVSNQQFCTTNQADKIDFSDMQLSVLREEKFTNASLREHQFWNHLYETLFTKLKTTFQQLLGNEEPTSLDDQLEGILKEAISHACSESSLSESSEASPNRDLASPLGRLDVTEELKASGEDLGNTLEENKEIDFMEFSNAFTNIPYDDLTDYTSQPMIITFPNITLPDVSNDTSIPPGQILDMSSNTPMNFIDDPRAPTNGTAAYPLNMLPDAIYDEGWVPQLTDPSFVSPIGEVSKGAYHLDKIGRAI